MAYLNFNKERLVNLLYSLRREILGTNRAGGYFATSIVCCNTRKYHGLLVTPIEEFNGEKHVLLSALDETVIQHSQQFNLGIHKYPGGIYEPKGHKYCIEASYEPVFALTYRVGGVILKKEIILDHDHAHLMVRYTLEEASIPTTLRLKPFLAFRNVNALSKENMDVQTNYRDIENGVCGAMYPGFPNICLQISKKTEYLHSPDWYRDIEYTKEQERGYEYKEDLFVPGYFEFPIKKGEAIVFSASLEPVATKGLKAKFSKNINTRHSRDNFVNCLKYSARQFISRDSINTALIAGYPWYGIITRDAFIALPGIAYYGRGEIKTYKNVLDTLCKQLSGSLFPCCSNGAGKYLDYNSCDTSLWFFKALQEFGLIVGDKDVWRYYKNEIKLILNAYRDGIPGLLHMDENGLIWAKQDGKALTWMNAMVDGSPVTQRGGFAVEVNALWYNAICYSLRLAEQSGDKKFVFEWKHMPKHIQRSFVSMFWNESEKYLADYVDEYGQNMDIRPNQIFACSLEYSPLDESMRNEVLNVVQSMLLTPKGIRTLDPRNSKYKSECWGKEYERNLAFHQGSVFPWLLGAYVEASFRLYGEAFSRTAKWIMKNFEDDIHVHGVCSLSEMYDGNPPHHSRGAISQATSVGEILRIMKLIETYTN